jgi:hypothetical protein
VTNPYTFVVQDASNPKLGKNSLTFTSEDSLYLATEMNQWISTNDPDPERDTMNLIHLKVVGSKLELVFSVASLKGIHVPSVGFLSSSVCGGSYGCLMLGGAKSSSPTSHQWSPVLFLREIEQVNDSFDASKLQEIVFP